MPARIMRSRDFRLSHRARPGDRARPVCSIPPARGHCFVQPSHLLTDLNWAMERIGRATRQDFVSVKEFLDNGVPLAFGTDYPVEPITPFRGIYAAVTRKNEAGTREYFPEQKVTIEQAIAAVYHGRGLRAVRRKREGNHGARYVGRFRRSRSRSDESCSAGDIEGQSVAKRL